MDDAKKQVVLEQLQSARRNYAAKLPDRIEAIKLGWSTLMETWDATRLQEFHRLVHTMVGSAGTFGLPQVGNAARVVEIELKTLLQPNTAPTDTQRQTIHQALTHLHGIAQDALKQTTAPTEISGLPAAPLAIDKDNRLIYLLDHDTPPIQELITQLSYFGYETRLFEQPEAFEEALRASEPTAIIRDAVLSEASEPVTTSQRPPLTPGIPTLFISDRGDFHTRLRAVRGGSMAYFQKPIDIARLVDTLDALCTASDNAQYRVLIVDDSRSMAEYLSLTLEAAGMETHKVTNPLRIMDALETFQPDLILMDLYMPGCTGFEAAGVIRQQEAFVSVPIVYLSAETNLAQQLGAMSLGGDDFLTKPIKPAHLIASVTYRMRRARRLRSFMVKDGLTGLYNHTTTKEHLAQNIDRARRHNTTVAFALLDIDHFKWVNDTYGHPTGDRVIKSLARLLKQRLRRTDMVGRFGGEEFAAILPDTNGQQAKRIMDNLRVDFSRLNHYHEEAVFQKSFSCGIATYPTYQDAATLNDAADKALYMAKNNGRNQVFLRESDTPGM
jgi:diguanylate cyclase (GGDEF)-like protein